LLRRLLVTAVVFAAAFAESAVPAQETFRGFVAARCPARSISQARLPRDGGRTTDVEVALAPAQDVRFRMDEYPSRSGAGPPARRDSSPRQREHRVTP